MQELIQRAQEFATRAHTRIDQRRKYTGKPYDVHLKAVADLLSSVTDDEEMIAAAWLHDTVEDTPATFADLEREFGAAVAELVAEVTDVSRPADGNRSERKAIDREHLAVASPRGQTIKLADMIDNCRDILRHDPRFARTYFPEQAALLEVLTRGDPLLIKQARKVIDKGSLELGVVLSTADEPVETRSTLAEEAWEQRTWQLFARVFAARDICEPLRSFDGDRPAQEVARVMHDLGLSVIGIRVLGLVVGCARLDDLGDGRCEKFARPIGRDQVVGDGASLSEVIHVLTRREFCFVEQLGSVTGYVMRQDIQKPAVRMWLFGMITLIEMIMVTRLRKRWPNDAWAEKLAPARLDKARKLLEERRRRGQHAELIDCLQLSDKATLLANDPEELAALGFDSRRAARRVIKELESLRNNLAHAQDIVTHDWAQIARMTARIEADTREQ